MITISSNCVSFEKYQEVVKELEDERNAHATVKAELSETQDRLELALGEVEILQKQLQREKAQFEKTFLLVNNNAVKNNTEEIHEAGADSNVDGCDAKSMFAHTSLSGSKGSRDLASSEIEQFRIRPSKSTLSSLSSETEFRRGEVVLDNFSTVVASELPLISQMRKDSRVSLKSSSNESLKSFASSKTSSRSSVASGAAKKKMFTKPGQRLQNSLETQSERKCKN